MPDTSKNRNTGSSGNAGRQPEAGQGRPNILLVAALFLMAPIFLLAYVVSAYLSLNSTPQTENYQEMQYIKDDRGVEKSDRNKNYVDDDDEAVGKYSEKHGGRQPYADEEQEFIDKGKEAITEAVMKYAATTVDALDPELSRSIALFFKSMFGEATYNGDRTFQSFYNNPFPYALKINDVENPDPKTDYYSIGDFLLTHGYSGKAFEPGEYKEIPEDKQFNDLNFAELNAVLSQGMKYNLQEGKVMPYRDLFATEESRHYLFELTVEGWHPWYYGEKPDPSGALNDNGTIKYIPTGEYASKDELMAAEPTVIESSIEYYFRVVIKPFGLRELYKISGVEDDLTDDYVQPGDNANDNYPGDNENGSNEMKNYRMLDFQELYDRAHTNPYNVADPIEEPLDMGPSYSEERSRLSTIYGFEHPEDAYEDGMVPTIDGTPVKTGRSANFYIVKSHLLFEEDLEDLVNGRKTLEQIEALGDLPADLAGADVVEACEKDPLFKKMWEEAKKYIGLPYIWGGYDPNKGFDCSGFVYYVINHCGNGWNMGRQTAEGLRQSLAAVSTDDLKPGDIVFFQGTNPNQVGGGASHVGIYIGNGMMIHTGSSKKPLGIVNINTPYYRAHFMGAGRLPGMGTYSTGFTNAGSSSSSGGALWNGSGKGTVTDEMLQNYNVIEGAGTGSQVILPSGLGSAKTYMGWQTITSRTSAQYKLREKEGMNFDSEGFARIDGRYVVATTTTYGKVGDKINITQADGTPIYAVIGDIKNQNDSGCNKWGHLEGQCVVEFIVDKDTWYSGGHGSHANPGTNSCHPEWAQGVKAVENLGPVD